MEGICKALCISFILFLFLACEEEREGEPLGLTSPSAEASGIFHHQKEVSYGDSLHIRVLSWGGKEKGSYLVLVADSLNQHFIGNSYFRSGNLANIWVDDLDEDGFPEIGVVLRESHDLRYGRLFLHELAGDFTLQSVNFPPLSEELGADYGGGDSIYRREDKTVVREFQLLNRLDTLSRKHRKRRVFYSYENKQLNLSGSEEIGLPDD